MNKRKIAIIGGVWGLGSALLFYLFPEAFNVYQNFSVTWVSIPEPLKVLMVLPIYLTTWVCNPLMGSEIHDPWSILFIAPLYTFISVIIGGLMGKITGDLVYKFRKQ